ncbi:MAG: hypothetical protein FWB96_12485 [Defluviitaleaceae bacterium]|nr:hypothetical protein [Defluviitaleaceae bacterium]MCL2264065.1 hypothetical protein [Defluviitaleaceae bacterium]
MNGRFEGWYFKHQVAGKSLAVIPGRADDSAFIWVITDKKSYSVLYPLSEYDKRADRIRVGNSTFSASGISVDIQSAELSLVGNIMYENLTPIRGDIMGPFRFFPMECRHEVISMNHAIHGTVILNGETQNFSVGKGYIEADSGRSFPSEYTWIHSNAFETDCSIMVSVARIPFYGLRFWGCICVVMINGREYRLATYKGVKIQRCERGAIELRQGKFRLHISIGEHTGQILPAPSSGKMSRSIRETLSCPAHFRFTQGNKCLFEGTSDYSSYEYMMDTTIL